MPSLGPSDCLITMTILQERQPVVKEKRYNMGDYQVNKSAMLCFLLAAFSAALALLLACTPVVWAGPGQANVTAKSHLAWLEWHGTEDTRGGIQALDGLVPRQAWVGSYLVWEAVGGAAVYNQELDTSGAAGGALAAFGDGTEVKWERGLGQGAVDVSGSVWWLVVEEASGGTVSAVCIRGTCKWASGKHSPARVDNAWADVFVRSESLRAGESAVWRWESGEGSVLRVRVTCNAVLSQGVRIGSQVVGCWSGVWQSVPWNGGAGGVLVEALGDATVDLGVGTSVWGFPSSLSAASSHAGITRVRQSTSGRIEFCGSGDSSCQPLRTAASGVYSVRVGGVDGEVGWLGNWSVASGSYPSLLDRGNAWAVRWSAGGKVSIGPVQPSAVEAVKRVDDGGGGRAAVVVSDGTSESGTVAKVLIGLGFAGAGWGFIWGIMVLGLSGVASRWGWITSAAVQGVGMVLLVSVGLVPTVLVVAAAIVFFVGVLPILVWGT